MGAKPTKLRQLYKKKLIQRKKQFHRNFPDFDINDDDRTLLLSSNHPLVLEMETAANFEQRNDATSTEIRQMKQELSVRIQQMHCALDELEIQHNRELDECANRSMRIKSKSPYPPILGDPQLEECRLKNALLMEKLRSCHEQLNHVDDPLPMPKHKDGKERNTFMRQLLVKTARRQFKKSRLNDAIETFYQLVVATNGQLCAEEAWLLFDICSQKIAGTYDFYHRIGNLMRELDPGTSAYIVNELWTSIVEDLRNECAEMHDVVMAVRVEVAEPLEESCVVEKLKYLTTLKISALWLQITPLEHDEFDDIKDLFYDSLGKDVDAFANLISFDNNNTRAADMFRSVIEDLYTKYPIVAKTRKLQKIATKILGRKADAIPYMLKDTC